MPACDAGTTRVAKTRIMKMENLIGTSRRVFIAAAIAVLAFAASGMRVAIAASEAESLHARIDSVEWVATRTLATPTRIGSAAALNLNGFLDAKPMSRFGFNLILSSDGGFVGSYALGPNALKGSHGSFVANAGPGGDPLADSFRFASGTVTIDRYDEASKRIWGKFSGSAKNSSGKVVTVTDGVFAAVAISPPPGVP
jgi:hypothetical protein